MSELEIPDPLYSPNLEDFHIICRICMKKPSAEVQIHPIHTYIDAFNPEEELDLSQKIKLCSDIKIIENDDSLPSKICDNCVNLVLIAHHFRVLSATSDEILKKIVATAQVKSEEAVIKIELDYENNSNYYPSDDGNIFFHSYDEDSQQIQNKKKKHKSKKRSKLKQESIFDCDDKSEVTVKGRKMRLCKKPRKIRAKEVRPRAKYIKKKCSICNMKFKKGADLSRHMETCEGPQESGDYKCYGCDIVFTKYSQRTQHEKFSCPSMPPGTKYRCNKCDTACDNRFRYEHHIKRGCGNDFSDPEPELSPKTKSKPQELDDMNIPDPIYKCTHCDHFSTSKSCLNSHILNLHTEKTIVCDICGRSYSTQRFLKVHKDQIHAEEKIYKCSSCPYETKQRSSLRLHIRIHTNDYRYSCDICGKSYFTASSYRVHVKTNHEEKKFQCDYCKKKYSIKPRLNHHIKIHHLGIKDHKCKECDAAFAEIRPLRTHMLKYHNIVLEKHISYGKMVRKKIQESLV